MKKIMILSLAITTLMMVGCEDKKYQNGDKVRVVIENIEGVIIAQEYRGTKVILIIKFRPARELNIDPKRVTSLGGGVYTMEVLQSECERIDEFSTLPPPRITKSDKAHNDPALRAEVSNPKKVQMELSVHKGKIPVGPKLSKSDMANLDTKYVATLTFLVVLKDPELIEDDSQQLADDKE